MINRTAIKLKANPKKVILRFFNLSEKRSKNVINRVLALDEKKVWGLLNNTNKEFSYRHRFFEETLMSHYQRIEKYIETPANLSNELKLLLGSYFSMEYSIESAALFNPSIVPHPNQSNVESDNLKIVLSLRATGEGHISSIEFREGFINADGDVSLDEQSSFSTLPSNTNMSLEEIIDRRNLRKQLTAEEIKDAMATNYSCEFSPSVPLSERVIFPYSQNESKGLEDVRLVKFINVEESAYIGTYTAYNGKDIKTQLLKTKDFISFEISTLHGNAVKDKGFALFPRKINDKFVMTSRQDGENLYIMHSDNLYYWEDKNILKTPEQTWEYIQIGNCGSPIETEHGWLLITHAVGPFRKYVISAILLDIEDPSQIIGQLNEPLIEPNLEEREGYVPNVVYSCGSLIHKDNLIIPYAMSDSTSGFAKAIIKEVINKIKKNK